MPVSVPDAIPADGTVTLKWVPVIADPSAPKLATEINAVGSLALECYLTEMFTPGSSAESFEDTRMCSKQVFSRFGRITRTIEDIVYVYDVQNPSSESNKAYAALTEGTTGFLVARWGVDVDDALATGDVVDVFPVELGPKTKMPPEANSVLKTSQSIGVIGPVAADVAIVT